MATQLNFGYSPDHYTPKSIAEQVHILRRFFPRLWPADEKIGEQKLPPHTEGWFAIPRWELVAKTYGEATKKVYDLTEKTRDSSLYDHKKGPLDLSRLRQTASSFKTFRELGHRQSGFGTLVVPAQFGLHHRNRSVRKARECMSSAEFGLGAFAVCVMLLTHPERLESDRDLWVDCPGDGFSYSASGLYYYAPCFGFGDGAMWLSVRDIRMASINCGSASARLPLDNPLR